MLRSTLQRFGRSAFDLSSSLFGAVANDFHSGDMVDVHSLEHRLRTAQAQAQPGFMALRAVRSGLHIVDFEWQTASVAATCLMRGGGNSLLGRSLVEVLAGRAGRGEIFEQYRCVVEFGAARAVQQTVVINHSVDVLRHAAVRLHDGVAVTLTNLSAVRRSLGLQREIRARMRMLARARA